MTRRPSLTHNLSGDDSRFHNAELTTQKPFRRFHLAEAITFTPGLTVREKCKFHFHCRSVIFQQISFNCGSYLEQCVMHMAPCITISMSDCTSILDGIWNLYRLGFFDGRRCPSIERRVHFRPRWGLGGVWEGRGV